MAIVSDSPIDLSDFVKGEPSVEDGLEVSGVEFDCAVVELDSPLEFLLLAGLPAVGVKHICLPQRILPRQIRLRKVEFSQSKSTVVIGSH